MLDFIKKLFKKEEIIPIEKIKKSDLEKWFQEKSSKVTNEAKIRVEEYKKSIAHILEEAEASLKKLEEAGLRNPKIDIREKQFMEGNRKSYTHKTAHLFKEIGQLLDYDLNFFLLHYKEYITNFAKSSERAFRIVQQFFDHETHDIASRIKSLDDEVQNLTNDDKVKASRQIEKAKKDIISLENKIKKKAYLKSELKRLEKDLEEKNKKEKDILIKLKQLKDSKEYKDIEILNNEKNRLDAELKNIKNSLYSNFSKLERPLRKYQRMALENEKLIEHYSTDAMNAFSTDSSLKILHILDGLKKNIQEGKLGLKDKILDKVVAQIDEMDEKYFKEFLKKYNSTLKNQKETGRKIDDHITKKELKDLDEKNTSLKTKIHEIRLKISNLKQEIDSINIESIKNKLKEEIENIFKIKLEFI
jgi:hypothetical protein